MKGKTPRHLSDQYLNQISVLKAMSGEGKPLNQRQLDISTIAQLSGLKDEKETQRYLYILEGHKLVTPHPEGDFTSKFWSITKDGIQAVKTISKDLSF